jgi:hypothetical protein
VADHLADTLTDLSITGAGYWSDGRGTALTTRHLEMLKPCRRLERFHATSCTMLNDGSLVVITRQFKRLRHVSLAGNPHFTTKGVIGAFVTATSQVLPWSTVEQRAQRGEVPLPKLERLKMTDCCNVEPEETRAYLLLLPRIRDASCVELGQTQQE